MSLIGKLEASVRALGGIGDLLDGAAAPVGEAAASAPKLDADDTQPAPAVCDRTEGCELPRGHAGGCQIVAVCEEVTP